MAYGDAVANLTSGAASGLVDIKPTGSVEWVIHNVYYGFAMELYRSDGVNSFKFDEDSGYGAIYGTAFHVTSGNYIQIKNIGATSGFAAFDGIQTK